MRGSQLALVAFISCIVIDEVRIRGSCSPYNRKADCGPRKCVGQGQVRAERRESPVCQAIAEAAVGVHMLVFDNLPQGRRIPCLA